MGDGGDERLNIALTALRSAELRHRVEGDLESYFLEQGVPASDVRAVLALDVLPLWEKGLSPYALNKLRHMRRLSHHDLGPKWLGCESEEFDRRVKLQDERNQQFFMPVTIVGHDEVAGTEEAEGDSDSASGDGD